MSKRKEEILKDLHKQENLNLWNPGSVSKHENALQTIIKALIFLVERSK